MVYTIHKSTGQTLSRRKMGGSNILEKGTKFDCIIIQNRV